MVRKYKLYCAVSLAAIAGFVTGSTWRSWGSMFENPASWGWAAVGATIVVVGIQIGWQLKIAREQLRVDFYLKLREEFDDPWLRIARKELAGQFLAMNFKEGTIKPPTHDEIKERVMDFFEDMGMLYRRDYLDQDMIRDTFSYYGSGWWSASKDYIKEERKRNGEDKTIYSDFETLKDVFGDLPMKETKEFLLDELQA